MGYEATLSLLGVTVPSRQRQAFETALERDRGGADPDIAWLLRQTATSFVAGFASPPDPGASARGSRRR